MRYTKLICSLLITLVLPSPALAQAPVPPPPPAPAEPPKPEAPVDKKKAEADEKARKKAEKDKEKAAQEQAKKDKEREKKEKEKKEKEEKEKKKREKEKKDQAPEPAPPPPPQPEPAPPPPPPPPPTKPAATRVEGVGAARWTGIGFVEKGEVPSSQDPAAATGVAVPAVEDQTNLSVGYLRVGASRALFNPINDGETDDETAFALFEFDFGGGGEFRRAGALLIPWFDIDVALLTGKRTQTVNGVETDNEFKVFSTRVSGLFGIDFAIVDYVSLGPEIGYRMELYSIKFGPKSDTTTSAETGILHGLQYGAHLRLRTKSTAKDPARLFLDARYEFRRAEFQTARYAVLQAGVRAGDIYFTAWYEKRLGSSGSFGPGDVDDIGEAAAASVPIEERLGGGILAVF